MSETTYAGTPAPAPTVVVCARCGGAIDPGLERCPTCGAPQPHLRPSADAPSPVATVAGGLAGALGILLSVAWVWPDVFRLLHLGWLADWIGASTAHRMTLMIPITITFVMAQVLQQRRTLAATRQAWTPFARASGGQVEAVPRRLEAGAWTGGLEVHARAQRWLLTLDTTTDHSDPSTRLRCAVIPRRDFHLAVMPQNRVLKALTSPRIGGFLLGLGAKAAAGSPDEAARRHAMEELAFVVGPAIEIGEPEFDQAFLTKSDDATAARALLGDLRGPLLALRRPGTWWQLSLTAAVADGRGLLEYRESGVVRDAARLEAAQQVLIRMLQHLAEAGFIAEDSPASNP